MDPAKQKPLLLYVTVHTTGHLLPAAQVMEYLVSRGFEVSAIACAEFRSAVEQIGVKFFPYFGPFESLQTCDRLLSDGLDAKGVVYGVAPLRVFSASVLQSYVLEAMPCALESIRSALMRLRHAHSDTPDREIIVLSNFPSPGVLALRLGAVVPGFDEPIKTINISVTPPFWTTVGNPPAVSGVAYDDSEAGRARNECLAATWPPAEARTEAQKMLRLCGVAPDAIDRFLEPYVGDGEIHSVYDVCFACANVTLQMASPSVEYPTTSWPPHIKLAGFQPIKRLPADLVLPEWFSELRDKAASGKKVVFTAQGTVVTNYQALIIPTIRALAARDDILVVAVLGVRGATLTLGDGEVLPGNVRVIEYLPYDAVLPYTDVFVSNSGYGGLTHAVGHGVPVVQSGTTEDKMDIGRRLEYAGMGMYIRPVTPDSVHSAVNRILTDGKYRERALEIKAENDAMDSLKVIEDEIMALASSS